MQTNGKYCPIVGKKVKQGEYIEKSRNKTENRPQCQTEKGICDGNCSGCTLSVG